MTRLWRWLADKVVPPRALRLGHRPTLTVAQADAILREHLIDPLRRELWGEPPAPRPLSRAMLEEARDAGPLARRFP